MWEVKKIDAIRHVVKNGARYNEWQEAAMLQLIEDIFDVEKDDFSTSEIERLIEEASKDA